LVRAGSRYEAPEQSGITHFLEHMLFRGNATYPDATRLNMAFEAVGSPPNANTGVETTEFYFVSHPERIDEGLALLAGLVGSPTFPDLDKERQIILDEMLYDYNERGELVDLPAIMARMLWPDHPLGQSITGTPETLAGLGPEHLRAHCRAFFYPANCVLAVAGNVRAGTVLEAVRRHFGAWSGAPEPRRPRPVNGRALLNGGPRIKTVADSDNQFHVQVSFPAPGYNAPEEVPLLLLTRLLDDGPNSLLQRVVREERALVYGISGGYNGYQDAGQFDIATSVKAERLEELLGCLRDLLRPLCADGPSEEDLEAARRRHRYDLAFGRDSLSAWVDRYAWPRLYSTVRGETEELERVAAVTRGELQGLAARLFSRDRLRVAVVGPVEDATTEAIERVTRDW